MLSTIGIQAIPSISSYVDAVKSSYTSGAAVGPFDIQEKAVPVFALAQDSHNFSADAKPGLLETIQEEAENRKIAPINAKVDPVWKAIPGYNGLEVDVEETFKLAQHRIVPGNIQYVMKETPPSIQLEDLGPTPIYKGNPKKPMVSLMINVAWGDEYLVKMLDILRKENVHATFFLDGMWLSKHADMAKQILKEGHELSNHAYSHKDMRNISRAKATEEIGKTETLLKQLGVENKLFAPPSGYYKEETVQVAAEYKLKTILWTFDTIDWKNPGADRILSRFNKNVEPGTLVLMHPTASSSEALEGMIKIAKNKGLTLGTVSELLSPNRVQVADLQS
ncbi:polysaccharide deacetylase family protein [Paenibacillus hexagrammi]|uniref:Polysaccharide deacetylase family protein n=1 Tax=Paenibacillus hexagrammi TaxID=2908839 RepID=A0ABY3SNJ8_9BACL|nr:polysaccharide deacetylase family protein [Paenibacillus sp. YPD9-1]UJF35387.1 polysaccharide deacetylase family protein [Paenibacillus sp. YPD9-1]